MVKIILDSDCLTSTRSMKHTASWYKTGTNTARTCKPHTQRTRAKIQTKGPCCEEAALTTQAPCCLWSQSAVRVQKECKWHFGKLKRVLCIVWNLLMSSLWSFKKKRQKLKTPTGKCLFCLHGTLHQHSMTDLLCSLYSLYILLWRCAWHLYNLTKWFWFYLEVM